MSHEDVAEWDAAYVLGSLSPADRARFEEHLEDCTPCRTSVAEIAPLPGLLSRVPRERAEGAGSGASARADTTPSSVDGARPHGRRSSEAQNGAPEVADDPRARLIDLAGERARRRRRKVWAVTGAAAVVALAAVVAIPLLSPDETPDAPRADTLALETVVDVPVSASVDVADVPWGTRIDMTCRYDQIADAPSDGWGYALVVVATDGTESELSTWRAYAGTTAELSAGTELEPDEIASIEVRSIANGAVLLHGDPADATGE